jgi:hypothetical protein
LEFLKGSKEISNLEEQVVVNFCVFFAHQYVAEFGLGFAFFAVYNLIEEQIVTVLVCFLVI